MIEYDTEQTTPIENILLDWADWQERYRIKTGMPRVTIGLRSGGAVNDDSWSASYDAMISARCSIVDSCIDDLPPNQNAAIHCKYLHAVYRMRNYPQALADAYSTLEALFRIRNVVF